MGGAEFKFGDRLIHAGRPEWGTGVVTSAQSITHEGKKCQRLTLRFDRAGLKTITTGYADLRLASEEPPPPAAAVAVATREAAPAGAASREPVEIGWLAGLEAGNLAERMAELPETTRDPFASLSSRIKATLALYRFTERGSTILDWAAMQTGLPDPLTRFNRHELESFFKRFAGERDAHLRKLMGEARKRPSPEIDRLVAEAPASARDALRRGYP